MSDLPNGWDTAPIADVTAPTTQRVPAETDQFIYIDIASIDRETKVIAEPQSICGKDAPSRARKEVKAGDVLVSMTRPNLNAVAFVGAEFDGNIASTGFDVLRPIEIDSRWLFAHVRSKAFIDVMSELVQGALYPAVKSVDVRSFEIPIPPLNEQKRIADKLDRLLARVDAAKSRLDKIPALLKRLRQSILTAATTGKLTEDWRIEEGFVEGLPMSWNMRKASVVCEKVQSGSTPRGKVFLEDSGIPFLKVYNIVNQKVEFGYRQQFVEPAVHEGELKRSVAYPGDVLMNIVGPPLGKVAIVPYEYPEWNLNQAITLFRPFKNELIPEYLYYYLCEGKVVRDVMPETKGMVGQMNISLSQCRDTMIDVPPLAEQKEIVRRVEELFSIAERIEAQYRAARARVDRLTQSLLAKAFRGELVPQDPNDEPATALLERIRDQRAAAPKLKRGQYRKAAIQELPMVAEEQGNYTRKMSRRSQSGKKSK